MTKITSMAEIHENLKHLPLEAIRHIEKCITDWLASGGSLDDDFIKQQFRYVENLLGRGGCIVSKQERADSTGAK